MTDQTALTTTMVPNQDSKIAVVLPTQNSQQKYSETNGSNQTHSEPPPPATTSSRASTPEQTLQQQQHQAAIAQTQQICNQEALNQLQARTGYPIVQENGQRKYGPPPNWTEEEPDRSCEVFVGKIPRDCFEDELIPVLEQVGRIFEFRLMMEYSGYNRGYGFVMFTSRDHAKKAVSELNNFEIRKNRMIGLCRSVDNCRLFVGGIPKSKKREEILEEMRKVTEDVVNVIVYPSANDKSKNRGFAFVQYTNHRAAAVARRKLIPARIQLFGQPIAVDWAEPEPEVDDEVMRTVKVLYVRNLMLSTSEEVIKQEFERLKPGSVERVKKLKDFAFVHFKEREDALNAMKIMNGGSIDGADVEVTLSKPVDKNNYMRLTRQAVSPNTAAAVAAGATHLLIDPNEMNLLLGAHQSLSGMSSPHLSHLHQPAHHTSIPGFAQPPTVTFTDPVTNLQYQIPNPQHFHHSTHHQPHHLPLGHLQPMQNFAPSANIPLQHLQPQMLAQNQLLASLGNLVPDPSSLMNKPGNSQRLRMTPGSRAAAGIHRQAYYNNTVKMVNGGVKRQLSNEDALHDFYAGVKPVPMLSINTSNLSPNKYPTRPHTQILEEFCLKEGLAPPIYTLHTTTGKDQEAREINLYLYKVMLPSLFGASQLSSNRLMTGPDDAKNDAAEFVLMQLFPHQLPQNTDLVTDDINKATNQQNFQQQPTTPNKNAISCSDQTNILFQQQQQANQQQAMPMIPATSATDYPPIQPAIASQYFLDPNGQYLMYPTPGWQ